MTYGVSNTSTSSFSQVTISSTQTALDFNVPVEEVTEEDVIGAMENTIQDLIPMCFGECCEDINYDKVVTTLAAAVVDCIKDSVKNFKITAFMDEALDKIAQRDRMINDLTNTVAKYRAVYEQSEHDRKLKEFKERKY